MRRGVLRSTLLCLGIASLTAFARNDVCFAAEKKLSEADKLYRAKCTSCHRLLKPKDYSDEKWAEAVKKYGKKLTDEERKKILEFLQRSN